MCKRLVYRAAGGFVLLFGFAFAPTPQPGWLRVAQGADNSSTKAADKRLPATTDPRTEDRTAIHSTMESFAKAFGAGDAKALAAHWTSEGEYQNDAGVNLHGRAALEASFGKFFTAAPEPKAGVQPGVLRFLGNDTAIAEGVVSVRRGPAEPWKRAQYTALLVREEGRWRIAQLRELSDDSASIEDLSWLIGQWRSANNQGAEIRTTYSWTPSKKFIRVTFALKEKSLALGGEQVIGVEPATGSIRSWTFEGNGGVGEAEWQRDGDHWVLRVVGTLADGRTLKETNVLRRINDDTLTWQSVERTLGDTEVPDLPPVKVTRVKPEN